MKKRISSKMLYSFFAIAAALGILAGCSGKNDDAASGNTNADSANTSAESTEEGESGDSGETVTLKVEVFDRANQGGSDPTNNYWTEWINEQMLEKYNIKVEYVSVPRSEEVQQLNVLMASGSAPDIVFTYNQSVAYNYYKQGGLADLTDLLDTVGTNLKSYLGEEILNYGKFDDRQYLISAKRIARPTYVTYMRKDWLDTLGLPVPTNRQEFYEALVAFKEKNPGNVEQVIPYAAAADIPWHLGSMLDSFIDTNLTDEQLFVYDTSATAASSGMLYPGFKEGIKFANKLYNEGLLDPQFPLYKDFAPVDDLISRGQVGAFTHNYDYPMRTSPGVYHNLSKNIPEAELVPVDCFENADGKNLKQMYPPNGIYVFVPASSKNAEAAIKYLDFLSQDEARIFITTGVEGVNHEKDEEGIPVMINLENDNKMFNSPNNLDYALIVNGVDLGDEDKSIKVLSKSYEEIYTDVFMDAYDIGMKDAVVFNETAIPFDSEAQFSASLNDKRKEIMAAAITAKESDFDASYDAGINEWLISGGQQIVDERQAYWDANMK